MFNSLVERRLPGQHAMGNTIITASEVDNTEGRGRVERERNREKESESERVRER